MREIECSISGEKRVISDENTTVFYPSSQNGELPVKQSVVSFLYDTNMSDVSERETHLFLVCAVVTDFHEHCQKVR